MRQQFATRQANIDEGDARIQRIDASIAAIRIPQAKLQKELDEKRARAAELRGAAEKGEAVIDESVAVARAALQKASLLQRKTEADFIAGNKLTTKGCAHAARRRQAAAPPIPLSHTYAHAHTQRAPTRTRPLATRRRRRYDGAGRPIKGREYNLLKRNTVAARKPGDMVTCDDTAILARAHAVLRGENPNAPPPAAS